MFLAGIKTKILKSIHPNHLVCSNCKKENSTKISVTGAYKHVFQIPFLAGKKEGISKCSNCNEELSFTTMSDPFKLAYYELKETTKTPLWFYSGIIGIKLLVLIKIVAKYT